MTWSGAQLCLHVGYGERPHGHSSKQLVAELYLLGVLQCPLAAAFILSPYRLQRTLIKTPMLSQVRFSTNRVKKHSARNSVEQNGYVVVMYLVLVVVWSQERKYIIFIFKIEVFGVCSYFFSWNWVLLPFSTQLGAVQGSWLAVPLPSL